MLYLIVLNYFGTKVKLYIKWPTYATIITLYDNGCYSLLTSLLRLQKPPELQCVINDVQSDTKKWENLKNPTKIEEIQEKKFIDRN